ncbi:MAG: hypothetical protein EXR29_10550 [Betaproteobacteria bacterium]|nr:hypothetical protein [Betaproteobacteria bacterium]
MEIAPMKTTSALLLLAFAAVLPAAQAQTGKWPDKSVRAVVPFAPGGVPHLATEHFRQMTNTNMIHVPYKGDAPAIIDLLGGQIQFFFGGPLVLSPHINAGKLRGLAVTSEQRSSVMPDLPAVNELVPGYTAFTWFGMWAPPGTPKAIVAQLNQAIVRILKKPEVLERLRAGGMEAAPSSPEEYSRFIARDIDKWNKVVKAGNIKVD